MGRSGEAFSRWAWLAARLLFGLFFFATGLAIAAFSVLGVGHPPTQPTAAAQALTDALDRSRIMDPLLALSYLAGGGALLWRPTAPLGLVLLAPPVVTILAFHLVLTGSIAWGCFVTAWFAALVWHQRAAYWPLVRAGR